MTPKEILACCGRAERYVRRSYTHNSAESALAGIYSEDGVSEAYANLLATKDPLLFGDDEIALRKALINGAFRFIRTMRTRASSVPDFASTVEVPDETAKDGRRGRRVEVRAEPRQENIAAAHQCWKRLDELQPEYARIARELAGGASPLDLAKEGRTTIYKIMEAHQSLREAFSRLDKETVS
jgi:hypothetical protein